jgi:hypothetical protein
MSDRPIDLEGRRITTSRHAPDLRRLTAKIEADGKAQQHWQEARERSLMTSPADSWQEAADRARHLLGLLNSTSGDARIKGLIRSVLADFDRLSQPKT